MCLQFRKYPEGWQQVFQCYGPEDPKTKRRPIVSQLLGVTEERPEYNKVAEAFKAAGRKLEPF